ncbi:DUF4232 domain-containing protein [Cryobacterium sp. TMT1-21]|uniref:DUF4232 domain-containing protein n=1 Tax=Cryobacterium shii TaxID=1259235 RepID=A0AAQ2C673_9MICO|nr:MULTISPECIES: DUF4232 domain-containing protein [Cryobacterium]TFC46602.1 DUF4232 domain-containing protein [Cryobacterium shii]TFC89153.1 DUF4232 domain-containing protein [Cryobacterium sp. TmT2-59]TFD14108.1 DUF4232 domain-containing protein [Cryobacterium sp. TMT4-10]TFD17620.1 DUF4232 domain-containing protein [Cryobacterium sp. TMT1-21]TFD22703.1 DUF4232 domain-containing protein [Cryobacterium sp. TMT2-23]
MTGMRSLGRVQATWLECAAVVLVLAGCAAPARGPVGGSQSPRSTTAATPTATTTPTASAAPTATPTTPPRAEPGVCTRDHLALSLQARPHDSGMSSFYWDLRLTNTGSVECSVQGYPVVTLIDSNSGETIGAVSGVEESTVSVVPVAPGASAYSLLHLTQAGAHPDCAIVPVTALAVTLPEWDAAERVATPNPIEGCSDDSTVLVRTRPLAPAPVSF